MIFQIIIWSLWWAIIMGLLFQICVKEWSVGQTMMIVAGYGDVYISHISDVRLDYKLSDQDSYKHLSEHYTRCTGPIKIEDRKGNKKSQLSSTEMGTVHGPRVNLQVQAISLIFVGSLDM